MNNMKQKQINMRDSLTKMMIVYNNITFKEACKYLETLKRIGKYLGAEPFGNTTKLKFENAIYYYDEERRYLLKYIGG